MGRQLWKNFGKASVCWALFWLCRHAGAAPVVTSAADVGLGTLRNTIAAANPSDTITFNLPVGSVIALNSQLTINKDLTISGPGAAALSIVGANQRIFHVMAPAKSVFISGLHLQGKDLESNGNNDGTANSPDGTAGASAMGGGILNDPFCALSVSNCFFDGCQAVAQKGGDGFGIVYGTPGSGGIGGSAAGGAIYSQGNLSLYGCTFANNSALGGNGGSGGLGFFGGTGNNGGDAQGGAIVLTYNGALQIVDCTFFGNIAHAGNGGNGGNATSGLTAHPPANGGPGGIGGNAEGGAILVTIGCDPGSCVGIIHSTISQNVCFVGSGGTGGAGIAGGSSGANGVSGTAKGCGLSTASVPVGNTIVAGDYANPATVIPTGPDVYALGGVSSQGFNLIGIVDASSSGWISGAMGFDMRGTVGSPLDPRLGPLQNNGGETPTMAPLTGSPAIDTGTADGIGLDQAGQPRPVIATGILDGGDGSDIGAYELQCSTIAPTLTITPSGMNIILSWPAPSICYVLQESPDLGPNNWVNATYPVTVVGNQNQVVIPPSGSKRFFRLLHL